MRRGRLRGPPSLRVQPALGIAADPCGHAVELAVQPGVEGGTLVVVQQARLPEDLGDVPGGQVHGMQLRQGLRPPGVLAVLAAVQRVASPWRTRRRISPDHPRASARRSATRIAAASDGLAATAARAGVRRRQSQLSPGGF